MAYIIKRKNREEKYYVYLVEGYRDKNKVRQRTLKSYGSYEQLEKDEPGAYERLRREAKEGLLSESIKRRYKFHSTYKHRCGRNGRILAGKS